MNEPSISLTGFTLPTGRNNLSNDANVKWLIDNFGVANKEHPEYKSTMKSLVDIAVARNLISKSKARHVRQTLE